MTAIPGPWMDLMQKVGITSIRQLAKVAGLPDHTRANAVIMTGATTSVENMEKLASALRVPVEQLYRITSGVAARPLTMPAGTEKLSERQKNAVAEMVRTMVEEKEYVEKLEKLVDKKSPATAEHVQEKSEGRLMSATEQYELAARRELFPRQPRGRAKPAEKHD
ncbi:hypothetical protein [Pseudarthrobacter cellobiosi]|uniref:hypothetical protein n=1 Tax=Pseudarthrobacter cellobiosi TaxID=2953654 RepID=UPI00208EEAFD|nr:hypothetical protein [Pseudarthrobacter sp. HLT1-5]MCO4257347.1 hypothetical protein [Pseudarthrobacter sp. HLT1-5]